MTVPHPGEPFVLVISTGGTIASTHNPDGALVPTRSAEQLVTDCGTDTPVRVVDAARLDSSTMSLGDIDILIGLVTKALDDASITGIVITHGTDSMAETALALDVVHSDPRPVILTGAQRPADHPQADGPANLRRSIELAADPLARGRGVTVHFGGDTFAARGLIKIDTEASRAFALTAPLTLPRPAAVAPAPLAGFNAPILRAWPGAEATLVEQVAQQHPDGIVVEALGTGNVSTQMGQALAEAARSGTPIVLSTSVPYGEVSMAYGGTGGGATLADHGIIPAGWLRAGQARIALITALATGTDPRLLLGV